MKKTIYMVLGILLTAVLLTACGSSKQDSGQKQSETAPLEEISAEEQKVLIAYFTRLDNTDGDLDTIVQGGGPYGELGTSLEDADIDALSSASITIDGGKISGNTQAIANMIQGSIGGELFSIRTEQDYPADYEELIDYGNEEKNTNARPELSEQVSDMEEYDVVFLGFPNWWASIPMPVASFLEQYDFSGKTIVPFCSHGGGRFGQSLTAIAKLAPDSKIKEGLAVSYSGGSSLPEDIAAWLKENNINE